MHLETPVFGFSVQNYAVASKTEMSWGSLEAPTLAWNLSAQRVLSKPPKLVQRGDRLRVCPSDARMVPCMWRITMLGLELRV